jgi:hypothetical protein
LEKTGGLELSLWLDRLENTGGLAFSRRFDATWEFPYRDEPDDGRRVIAGPNGRLSRATAGGRVARTTGRVSTEGDGWKPAKVRIGDMAICDGGMEGGPENGRCPEGMPNVWPCAKNDVSPCGSGR